MNTKKFIILLSTLFFYSQQGVSQTEWEIDKSKNGIVVYTRAENDSDFKSFKATTILDANCSEIISILKDAQNYKHWYGYTKSSKLIKQEQGVQYNYVETIFPWPYQNRDMVYEMSINTLDSGATKITLRGIPDYIPQKNGIIRMQKAEGHILLEPRLGKTEITYLFHTEPGDIPAWLANNSIAELPFKTLLGLREILRVK